MAEAIRDFKQKHPSTTFLDANSGFGHSWHDVHELLHQAVQSSYQSRTVSKIASKLAGLSGVTDIFLQVSPSSGAIAWGAVKLLTQASASPSIEFI